MTERPAIAELIAGTWLFGGLDAAALADCAARFREVRHPAGASLFGRGEPGDSLFVVAEGRVRLSVVTEDGRELSFRHAVAGDIFGEIAALDGGRRSADAAAITAVVAHTLTRAGLDALRARWPVLSANAVAWLCNRLRETSDQLEAIALHPIEVRLARFLLLMLGERTAPPGRRVPLELGYSQGELAQLLGASRPKVNAALGALEKAGAIGRTADRLFCDRDKLARIAEGADG